ncbi:hypothetical protein [Staphylococcus aureus]|uniref:hypothetical protein n=1 Tax=Staphylococcus aureus TaxID=1280 RepID=UPI003BAC8824
MANPAEEIKVKKDDVTITVTKKAFDSYYSLVGSKRLNHAVLRLIRASDKNDSL